MNCECFDFHSSLSVLLWFASYFFTCVYIYCHLLLKKRGTELHPGSFLSSRIGFLGNFALIFHQRVFEECGCIHATGAGGPRRQPSGGGGAISMVGVVFQDLFPGTWIITPPQDVVVIIIVTKRDA